MRGRSCAFGRRKAANRGHECAGAASAPRSARGSHRVSPSPTQMRTQRQPRACRSVALSFAETQRAPTHGQLGVATGDTAALNGSKEASQAKWYVLTVRRYLTHLAYSSRNSIALASPTLAAGLERRQRGCHCDSDGLSRYSLRLLRPRQFALDALDVKVDAEQQLVFGLLVGLEHFFPGLILDRSLPDRE